MKVLITGAAGFLGSHLSDRFLAEGYEVIGMDNLITGSMDNIAHLMPREDFTFYRHDVSKFVHVPGELDYYLHFASPASPIDYLKMPIQTLKVGSLGTHNLLGLAKAKGARVLAGVSSTRKAALVREAGADEIVDLSIANLHDGLREQVWALTDGNGADAVIDPLGGDFFDAAIRAVAWHGRLVVVGFAASRIADLKANYLLLKNIEVSGIQISDYRRRMPELMQTCFEEVFALYRAGKIKPAPVTAYSLADYAIALDDLLSRRVAGRAVLHPQA